MTNHMLYIFLSVYQLRNKICKATRIDIIIFHCILYRSASHVQCQEHTIVWSIQLPEVSVATSLYMFHYPVMQPNTEQNNQVNKMNQGSLYTLPVHPSISGSVIK